MRLETLMQEDRVVEPKNLKTMSRIEIDSLSLESHNNLSFPNYNKGFINGKVVNLKSPMCKNPTNFPLDLKKGKICAILLMLLLLVPSMFSIFVFQTEDFDSSDIDELDESPELIEVQDDTITFNVKEAFKPRKAHQIRGTRGYSGTSPPVGDWTITGDAVVWNETITLDGNLTVTNIGNLTLINVTLKMNCRYNGEFHIEVLAGGGLYIYDFDWTRFTEDDASNITAINTSNKFLFWVRKDANFEMRNSKLSWCGYEWGSNGDHSGLWINTDYTIIQGNIFKNTFNGIIVYGGNYTIIENNIIKDNIKDKEKEIGLDISFMGVVLSHNNGCLVDNNTIYNLSGRNGKSGSDAKPGGTTIGIFLNLTNNIMVSNNIISNIKGGNGGSKSGWDNIAQSGGLCNAIYIYKSGNSTLINNTIRNNYGGIGGNAIDIRSHGGQGGAFNGINIDKSVNLTLLNNNIMNNKAGYGGDGDDRGGQGGICSGINIDQSENLTLINNTIINNKGGKGGYALNNGELGGTFNGIYIDQSGNSILIENNISKNNGGDGGNAHLYAGQGGDCNAIYIGNSNYLTLKYNLILNNKYGNGGSGVHGANGGMCIGINIYQSINSTFEDNIIINNILIPQKGIWLYQSKNNKFVRCNLSNNVIALHIEASSTGNNITECVFQNNRDHGIYFSNSPDNKITNTTVINNGENGIWLLQSPNNELINCNISNNSMGIFFQTSSSNNRIMHCTISNNKEHGIFAFQSSNNYFINNIIKNNGYYGIRLQYSNWNRVVNNTITNHTRIGLYFCVQASNNEIINCKISENGWEGIRALEYSYDNIIINSTILNSANNDFYLITDSHLTTINTNFDKNKVDFTDSKSDITVKWYLHVQVILHDAPMKNALVVIRDNANGTYEKRFWTKYDGFVRWIPVTEYVQNSANKIFFTQHELKALLDSYGGNVDAWMDRSKMVTIPLDTNYSLNCIVLQKGWNLISLPFIQPNTKLEMVLQPIEGKYDAVSSYNASEIADPWMHYHVSKPSYMNDLKSLDHKSGIWIHINVSEEIQFLVTGIRPTIQQTIELYPGWNLVGYPSIVNRPRDEALNNLYFGTDIDAIYYFDNSIKKFKSLNSMDIMKKGIGYWFHAKSKLTWILNNSIPPIYNLNKDIHYNTIQEAITNADHYDTIEITPGIYYENININKSMNIFGKTAGSIIIDGQGEIGFNISVNYLNLYNLAFKNCSFGLHINNSTNINLNDTLVENTSINGIYLSYSSHLTIKNTNIYNSSGGISIDYAHNVEISNITLNNNIYGIITDNSSKVFIVNSTIFNQTSFSLLLSNSNMTLLNVTLNTNKIKFLDSESSLTVQWYLHVQTKDQKNYPISGTIIRVTDNENGTYDKVYTTGVDGSTRWIIVIERIQNLTENISFTPHNITSSHSGYTFIEDFYEVVIDKSITLTYISVNTVLETPIYNFNKNRYYLTIKEAINDANSYDTIQLSSGTYFETIIIDKPLNLFGEDAFSTIINGSEEFCVNITSDDVNISNLNLQNCTYGIYSNSFNGLTISNIIILNCTYGIFIKDSFSTLISNLSIQKSTYGIYLDSCTLDEMSEVIVLNTTYGIYINNSSPIINGCIIEHNNFGILCFNSSTVIIINCTFQNEVLDLSLSDSYFTTLNTNFNRTKVMFFDSSSTLSVQWYLHVRVQDATGARIIGANVWIVDNVNGTYDQNFTTGSDGYVWYIILIERIQNQSGNISFNPYWINVSYYDAEFGYGWLNFTDNPRNIFLNGTLFEIRTEIFQSLETIPEFSHILIPIIAITASFVFFRKKRRTLE